MLTVKKCDSKQETIMQVHDQSLKCNIFGMIMCRIRFVIVQQHKQNDYSLHFNHPHLWK